MQTRRRRIFGGSRRTIRSSAREMAADQAAYRRVAVLQERKVGVDPVREPEQLPVPVKPPARILRAGAGSTGAAPGNSSPAPPAPTVHPCLPAPMLLVAADAGGDDQDRERDDQPEHRGQPVERSVRVLDRELRHATLNRWLPLVKWLLAIPHHILLARECNRRDRGGACSSACGT